MRSDTLNRLLAVARKTGAPLVIVDGDSGFVLLPIDHYERLADKEGRASLNMLTEVDPGYGAAAFAPPPRVPVVADSEFSPPGEEQFYLEPVE